MDDEGIQIPSYFLCPISLEIMIDPVILPTGISYDRENIERWIFSGNNNNKSTGTTVTCPVTKQVVTIDEYDQLITPNLNLQRVIQSWCSVNSSKGIGTIPTPRPPPVDRACIFRLIDQSYEANHSKLDVLKKLHAIVVENDRNKRIVESAGVVPFLVSVIKNGEDSASVDEALAVLQSLQLSDSSLIDIVSHNEGFVDDLGTVLKCSSDQSRAYAMFLVYSIASVINPQRLVLIGEQIYNETVRVIKDRISTTATKSALKVLNCLCPWGRNRIKAVKSGAVAATVELLIDEVTDKRVCELALSAMDLLCKCAEGRAELVEHSAGLAVVSKKILRVSPVASERAIRVILSVAKFSGTPAVVQEMMTVGVVSKLCLVLQADQCCTGLKAKEKAKEVLKLHSRAWKRSPCLSHQLLVSYPS